MLEPKRPTPVLSLFEVTQRLRRRLKPGERPMFRFKQDWEGGVMSFHVFIHARLIQTQRLLGWQRGGGKGASTSDAVVGGSAGLG